MAYSTIPKVRRDGTIKLLDSGGSTTLTVEYEEGNFTFDVPGGGDNQSAQTVIRDRGTITTVRRGDDEPITGSFSFYFRDFTDSDVGGVRDFVTKSNAYSGITSTGLTGSPYVEHFCIDIEFQVDSTLDGHSSNSKAVFSRCVCTLNMSEGDPGSWSLSFTSYGGVAYTAGS